MSKMSELATALDEMTETGKTLITCGESLVKAAAHVRECFTEETPAPAEESAPVTEPETRTASPRTYTKEEVRALLADLSRSGFRNEAKELVRKYSGGGSLTEIDPVKYPELVAEAEAYHA